MLSLSEGNRNNVQIKTKTIVYDPIQIYRIKAAEPLLSLVVLCIIIYWDEKHVTFFYRVIRDLACRQTRTV